MHTKVPHHGQILLKTIKHENYQGTTPREIYFNNITQSIPRYHAAQIILNNTLMCKNEISIMTKYVYLIGIVVYPKLVIQAKIEYHNVPRF